MVKVPQVKGYERVVTAREVSFTCLECGQTVTQERMPEPLPSYCSDRAMAGCCCCSEKGSSGDDWEEQGETR